MFDPGNLTDDLNLIAGYLAEQDVAELRIEERMQPAEILALMGSSLLGPVRVAAEALWLGLADRILICGGIGHSTPGLREAIAKHPQYQDVPTTDRPEADMLRDILVRHLGISPDCLLVESQSTDCGANAIEGTRLLRERGISPQRMILIQDPTMQRRSHASWVRAWAGLNVESHAPFVPVVRQRGERWVVEGDPREGVWNFDRFVSLVLGEIERLRDDENGYGPRGRNFIDHVEIPLGVLAAYERVAAHFATGRR